MRESTVLITSVSGDATDAVLAKLIRGKKKKQKHQDQFENVLKSKSKFNQQSTINESKQQNFLFFFCSPSSGAKKKKKKR
jgi:hypothetical protein